MKISKDKLKQIVREELESLTVLSERKIKGKAVGNFLKKGRAGRTLTMKGKEYTDLGKGKWKGPDNKKLDWIELSSMASALGDEMVTLSEQNISEAKVSPADKKQFQSDAQEILDNMEKAKLVNKDTEFHVVKNSLRHVFSAIANGEGNANYNKVKKYMPKKLNTDLYDNGEKNSYDSVWFSMNDAQRDTILKKAIKAKLNISEADVDENRALDNAIANRDANRANRKGIEQYQDLYFGLHKLIRQVSKNNKVQGYGGELTHAFVDLLWAVEDDRLAVGEIFNALKKVRSKISQK